MRPRLTGGNEDKILVPRRIAVHTVKRTPLCLAALVCSTALASCGQDAPPSRAPLATVRFTTGAPGGGFFPFGSALATAMMAANPALQLELKTSTGAVANVRAIQQGDAEVGFVFADVAYLAYVGQLARETPPFDQLRAIAVLQLTPVQLVARAGSGIQSVGDLRGRRVGMGPDGSGTALTAQLIFHAFGLNPDLVRTELLPFNEASERLVAGTLDAMFDTAMFPAESAARALRAGARLVPIEGEAAERLGREYPFLRMTVLPRETYPGIAATPTVGVDSLIVCRSTLDEDLVHDLTASLFDALPALSSSGRLPLVELDEAPAASIPLHEGAARYFREQELRR
jgi:uncharacterized protein